MDSGHNSFVAQERIRSAFEPPTRLVCAVPVWVWLGLAPALVLRLVVAWSSVEISFALSVPDDAYYYFTIARNIAGGQGFTFDGLAPTNGFHPLWMVLITPLWLVARSSATLPVQLALTLGAVLDLGTMLGIWTLALELTGKRLPAGAAVLVYAWNPYNLAASVNGLETSLGSLLLVSWLGAYWRMRLRPRLRWSSWLALGVLSALLLLTRTDYALILIPCSIDLLWRQRRQLQNAWAGVLGGAIWLPWLLWNWTTFGTLAQVSGKAYPYYLHAIWRAEGHSLREWLRQEGRMAYGILANLARLSGFDKGIVLLAIAAFVLIALSVARGKSRNALPVKRVLLSGLVWPTLGAVGLLLVHGLVRWMYSPWYFVPASILLALWLAAILAWPTERYRRWAILVACLCFGFQLLRGAGVLAQGGMWEAQRQHVVTGRPEFVEVCARAETVGISDSGYWGYYLPCRVVNLDGVVNNEAYTAIREGQFREYLDGVGIEHVWLNGIIREVVGIQEGPIPTRPPYAASENR